MKIQIRLQFIISILIISLSSSAFSQYQSRGVKYNYIDAESFYNAGNFYDALPLYQVLAQEKPENNEYQMKIGICHINLNQTPEKAIEYIKRASDNDPIATNAQYYLGRAYALNYRFKKAIEIYKIAETLNTTESYYKKRIPYLIAQCNNAINLVQDSIAVEIINLGKPINSSANEYSPIMNAAETELIYTYRGSNSIGGRLSKTNKPKENGSFNEDIYISKLDKNIWSQPESISDSLNTLMDEASISLSKDGEKLYLFKDTKTAKGDIFESIKKGDEWSEPNRLSFNSNSWEGHSTISSDGKKIIFSSDRPYGLGGKDLYSTELQSDGSWGDVKNLGPTINTIYDEDSPFLHVDGGAMNFSSKGHSSMGGYDVFESQIIGDSAYSEPLNIGYPINTTADDVFYTVLPNKNVYYSSARKGGYGQKDIYLINVNGINISGIARLYKDPKSAISKLVVNITNKEKTFNLSDTTDGAGRYNFSKLPSGDNYELFVEEIDESGIDDSAYTLEGEVTKMGRAFTKTKVNDQKIDDNGRYRLKIEKTSKGKDSKDVMSEEDILAEYGDRTSPGLIYKVQIAALTNVNKFEYIKVKSLGEVESIELGDGLVRLMVGNATTLKEITKLLEKAKSKGQDDAFIIVFVNGKRTYLEELVKENTFE
jgi:tetratricopeptide (TPR) repeat protein